MEENKIKVITNNRKAFHDFFILDNYEAGIQLTGCEVKSIRAGKLNLSDSFVYIERGEAFLRNCHISPYTKGNINNIDALRDRRLLLHSGEIIRLFSRVREKGLSIVPLKVYFKGALIKIEIGLAQGKKLYDKREAIKEKDIARSNMRASTILMP